ncbi:hypothetical protein [Flavobacterium sp. CS20]|jgi:hypothetical protein|uniref:hypothetical protein n=1 Tax=Flavobacterium sp. CS20 TaxID=2775246 RepID=UPI001B3A440A|nr:hypothetical protein [Flavobacterium sp. CS20]QTY26525.1 hypothetical protein IGB25_11460 [Flavobacterium sp. CS20]
MPFSEPMCCINSQNNLAFLQTNPIKTTDSIHLILRDFRGQIIDYKIKDDKLKNHCVKAIESETSSD